MLCSLISLLLVGSPRSKALWLDPLLKLNTVPWLMLLLKLHGSLVYLMSLELITSNLLSSIVTTNLLYTLPETLSFMNARNILTLIVILLETRLWKDLFSSLIFPLNSS
uniref:Uncharacterized protein n=1 Tax=Opuntia streptacantha TaxID=393608 RepID=A0A7C8YY95_OPUST